MKSGVVRTLTAAGLVILLIAILLVQSFAAPTILIFTQEELDFIAAHPVIQLGVDPKFVPFEFIDSDGSYKGIATDYLNLITSVTGLEFKVATDLTWTEAYEKAVLGELDALPCVSITKEREQYFLFTDPYYAFQRVLIVHSGNRSIKDIDDIQNMNVVVQLNSSHHGFLRDNGIGTPILYKTVEEALKAVSSGQETVFLGNLATSSYLIKSNGITNLKYIPIDSGVKQTLHIAVRKDWPILVSILNKSLASITEEKKIEINNRWIGLENQIDYSQILRIAGMIGALVLLVFVVSLYWILKLRKEVFKRKQTEVALQKAKEEAERANQVKSTFLARMSHEIRTPLNAITGMVYITKKTNITTTQRIYLDKIAHAAKDMLGIINDILDFSKVEAGKIEIERISFSLDDVLEQLVSIVSHKVDEQHIDFSVQKDAVVPTYFWGDPKKLEQILLNIVNNAMKFTADGAVTFTIRQVAQIKDSHVLEFSIKDTGIGMSQEQIAQLFTPFKQADSSTSRKFGGTGLGLSIVKSFVELMGGSITVYSEVGEGSTFNIQLTLDADYDKDYEARQKNASIFFQNIRALVLVKSLFYTNLMKDYMHSFSIVADFAQSEERAMQMMQSAGKGSGQPYNLLIVDEDISDNTGISICSRLKNLTDISIAPKTILLIPVSQEELFDRLDAAGLDLGITKPIIPSILYNGILELFKSHVLEAHDQVSSANNSDLHTTNYPFHILVVEDNKTNQFIAKSVLEQAGFIVSLADDGKEGVSLYERKRHEIHMILMDLHMPIMDGYDAAKYIRNLDTTIPLIAMSADAISGVDEKYKSVGFDMCISKPFDPDALIETILNILRNTHIAPPLQPNASQDEGFVLDTENGMKHIGGNESIYRLILNEYYQENKTISDLIRRTVQAGKVEEAIQIVHKLKSSSGSIGASGLHKAAIAFQANLAANNPNIQQEAEVLCHLLERVLSEINDYIS